MSDKEPVIEISTLKPPTDYAPHQLKQAMLVAVSLQLESLVLCERPEM